MNEYEKALADIGDIRSRMASGTTFRGLGPTALAATAALAVLTAALQHLLMPMPSQAPVLFFASWIAVAVVGCGLVGAETVARSRRHHGGLADAMIHQAIQQFLPCGAAGAAIAAILARFAPGEVWLLPGLWQVLVGLGLFSAAASLPAGTRLVAAWYFVAGCAVLMIEARSPVLSPWSMGIPFAIGQAALAVAVHRGR